MAACHTHVAGACRTSSARRRSAALAGRTSTTLARLNLIQLSLRRVSRGAANGRWTREIQSTNGVALLIVILGTARWMMVCDIRRVTARSAAFMSAALLGAALLSAPSVRAGD